MKIKTSIYEATRLAICSVTRSATRSATYFAIRSPIDSYIKYVMINENLK